MEKVIIKVSGQIAENPEQVRKLSEFVAELLEKEKKPLIVHGGGVQTDRLSERLQVPVNRKAGRRITDEDTLEVFLYTVAGEINTGLVGGMRQYGLTPVGLTGVDGMLTTSVKREPIDVDKQKVDFGLVGEINEVDTTLVDLLCLQGYVPVIACITWSDEHGILNINADTFSAEMAVALKAGELIMLMEPEAVLSADEKPVGKLTVDEWQQGLNEGWIQNGMQPKLQNGFRVARMGVPRVRLTNTDGLLGGKGTLLMVD